MSSSHAYAVGQVCEVHYKGAGGGWFVGTVVDVGQNGRARVHFVPDDETIRLTVDDRVRVHMSGECRVDRRGRCVGHAVAAWACAECGEARNGAGTEECYMCCARRRPAAAAAAAAAVEEPPERKRRSAADDALGGSHDSPAETECLNAVRDHWITLLRADRPDRVRPGAFEPRAGAPLDAHMTRVYWAKARLLLPLLMDADRTAHSIERALPDTASQGAREAVRRTRARLNAWPEHALP